MLKWLNRLMTGDEPQPSPKEAIQKITVTGSTTSRPSVPLAVRQYILDGNNQILGYEYSLGHSARPKANNPDRLHWSDDEALIRTIYAVIAELAGQTQEVWFSLSDSSIDNPLIEGLPAETTVILVRPAPRSTITDDILTHANALKNKGFRLALPTFSEAASIQGWLPLVDYICLDAGTLTPAELKAAQIAIRDRCPEITLIARRIDSYEDFEACQAIGFDAYSGAFLTRRQAWPPQPPLHADRVTLCQLLNRLHAGDDLNDVADTLRRSPELSYRLLRYINSAGMGLPTQIASIDQGLMFLGREKLYRWLTLLLFSSGNARATDMALLEIALVRGRLMELLGSEKLPQVQCDELFIVGMFSLIDILFRLPIDQALSPLQLPDAANQALKDGLGPYAPYLRLATACEPETTASDALQDTYAADATEINVTVERITQLHFQAVAWAQQLGHDTG